MEKKFKIAMIVMWSVIAIVLAALLIFGMTTGIGTHNMFRIGRFNMGPSKVQKQETATLDSCDKIRLDFSSSDILVKATDDNELKVIQRGNGDFKDDEKFTISNDNNTVTIQQGRSRVGFFIFGFGNTGSEIELDIPKSYAKDLDIETSSGDVTFDSDMNLNSLKCTLSSGDLECRNNITANEISLDSASGDIDMDNLNCSKYDVSDSSGDITIKALSGSGRIEATSGDININYSDIGDYSDISVSSGDIHINVPKSLSFEFSGKCTSGDINSDFDMSYNKKGNEASAKVGDGPYKKINAETTSGDIHISLK